VGAGLRESVAVAFGHGVDGFAVAAEFAADNLVRPGVAGQPAAEDSALLPPFG